MLYFRQLSIECLFLDTVCPLSHKGCADKFYAVYNRKTFNSMQIMPLIFSSWAVISAHAKPLSLQQFLCHVEYIQLSFYKAWYLFYFVSHRTFGEPPTRNMIPNECLLRFSRSQRTNSSGFFLVFLLELLKLCQSSKTFKCQFPILSLVFFLSLFFVTAQKAFFIQSFFCYCEFVKQTGVPLTVSKKI